MLSPHYRKIVREAIQSELGVVSRLHEHLSDDSELSRLAREKGIGIVDVRKIYMRIFYTGRI